MRLRLLFAVIVSLCFDSIAVGLYLWKYPEVSGGVLIACAVFALVGSFGLLWFGPKLQLASMPDVTGAKEKFDVENEARKSMAALLAASFFLFSGYTAFSNFESSLNKDRTSQLTDALKMLEDEKASIRVAGANSLALLTRQFNSKGDYTQAIRAMNDVVQQHTTLLGKTALPDNSCGSRPAPPPEIQRLLRFLGNRRYASKSSDDRLMLDDTDLRGAFLGGTSMQRRESMWTWATSGRQATTYIGDWAYASFNGSALSAANFENANLEDAQFGPSLYTDAPANLSPACVQFSGQSTSQLVPTTLAHADLKHANFFQADMQGVQLLCADARNASFPEANLSKANLECANLQGANFNGADLSGVDMSRVLCVDPKQLAAAKLQPAKKPDFGSCPANWSAEKCNLSTPDCMP